MNVRVYCLFWREKRDICDKAQDKCILIWATIPSIGYSLYCSYTVPGAIQKEIGEILGIVVEK